MFQRLFKPLLNRSFFLFGARGVGKTSWLEKQFKKSECLWLDLLDEDHYERYSSSPQTLDAELKQLEKQKKLPSVVVIDEVQRVPRLLNVVQSWIYRKKLTFVLTGSSARKLTRGAANLLGGRANSYCLYPLSAIELGSKFELLSVLEWGSLPEIFDFHSDREKRAFLKAYCSVYLKEEILVEQLIRKLPPFRRFMGILAQNEGHLINFEKFSRDIGVDNKTIQAYIEILEETYLGLLLRPIHPSLRKSQLQSPKFYFFDRGVQRQLSGTLSTPLVASTSAYGDTFEAFVIQEINALNSYLELDYALSFYTSKHGFEVDLILSKASENIFIEIKSTEKIDEFEVKALESGLSELKQKVSRIIYLSRDKRAQRIGNVECLYYLDFLKSLPQTSRNG